MGCEPPTSHLGPEQRELLVHAALDVGSPTQIVMLAWSDGAPMTAPENFVVTLRYPDGHERGFQLESGGTRPRYQTLPASVAQDQILPCQTYELRIVRGQDVVTGSTTVPCAEESVVTMPLREFSKSQDTLRLSWARVSGAKAYYIAVQNRFTNNPVDPGFSTFFSTFADTSIVWPGRMRSIDRNDGDAIFENGANTTIVVYAADDNFYSYYHAQVDPFAGAPPSRLEGAIGVFGSIVPILRQGLTVVP